MQDSIVKPIEWLPYLKSIDLNSNQIYYLKTAYRNGLFDSTDPSTQLGAVIVDEDTDDIIAFGANHFPRGVTNRSDRWERPLKYMYVEHAERNSIYAAALSGLSTLRTTMFCPWYSCSDCCRGIIQSGITKVIGHKEMFDKTPDRWRESIQQAFIMFEEAGIECYVYSGKLFPENKVGYLFNGEIWYP